MDKTYLLFLINRRGNGDSGGSGDSGDIGDSGNIGDRSSGLARQKNDWRLNGRLLDVGCEVEIVCFEEQCGGLDLCDSNDSFGPFNEKDKSKFDHRAIYPQVDLSDLVFRIHREDFIDDF